MIEELILQVVGNFPTFAGLALLAYAFHAQALRCEERNNELEDRLMDNGGIEDRLDKLSEDMNLLIDSR